MNKQEISIEVFNKVGNVAKTADFVAAGLKNYEVVSLCNQGYVERIRNGFYKLPNTDEPSEEILISKLLPQGIVCVESALFHYGYSDFAPREWSVAVPRSFSRAVEEFNGVALKVYDRERTICDCFKYRTKLDNEIFNKAVNTYALDSKKNLTNLSKYANEMGVYKNLMNIMEVLLNR